MRTVYVMTDYGRKMREIVKDYNYLGLGELSRERRRRQWAHLEMWRMILPDCG